MQGADEEVFETKNVNDDFDQINQDKLIYTKFSGSSYSNTS
jgi:hypothetical protein